MRITGSCHCGNISFVLDWQPEPTEIPARACSCSFCTKHGGVWTSHPGAVLSPAQLLEAAWDDASGYRPQRVKFVMLRLRRKLGWEGPDSRLETIRGYGYRYRAN